MRPSAFLAALLVALCALSREGHALRVREPEELAPIGNPHIGTPARNEVPIIPDTEHVSIMDAQANRGLAELMRFRSSEVEGEKMSDLAMAAAMEQVEAEKDEDQTSEADSTSDIDHIESEDKADKEAAETNQDAKREVPVPPTDVEDPGTGDMTALQDESVEALATAGQQDSRSSLLETDSSSISSSLLQKEQRVQYPANMRSWRRPGVVLERLTKLHADKDLATADALVRDQTHSDAMRVLEEHFPMDTPLDEIDETMTSKPIYDDAANRRSAMRMAMEALEIQAARKRPTPPERFVEAHPPPFYQARPQVFLDVSSGQRKGDDSKDDDADSSSAGVEDQTLDDSKNEEEEIPADRDDWDETQEKPEPERPTSSFGALQPGDELRFLATQGRATQRATSGDDTTKDDSAPIDSDDMDVDQVGEDETGKEADSGAAEEIPEDPAERDSTEAVN